MKLQIKKTLAIFTIVALLFTHTAPAVVWAEETPATPENTNTAPAAPENTNTAPTAPTAPSAPNSGEATPTATPAPEQQQQSNNNNSNSGTSTKDAEREAQKQAAIKAAEDAYWANQNAKKTGTTSNGNVGDTVINTGDATNGSATVTNGNNNAATSTGAVTGNGSGAAIVNSGNGVGSNNNGSSSSVVNNDTNQNNAAVVSNNANQSAVTGSNQSSGNVGDTTIKTGDSNTSATAITAVNTNVDGVTVSEFNIADDHVGDIVLTPEAFAANCVSGCGGPGGTAQNTGNGAYSDNNASNSSQTNNNTNQNNNAVVGNTMNLVANSGDNDASFNTGGDNVIYTGDANVSANALTFANNNIAGNVTYGVVNIYGNLRGDIIIPDFTGGNVDNDGTSTNVANTGNGADSNNNASNSSSISNNTNQTNNANIVNDLNINANTGGNDVSYSTGGDNAVKTGNTTVDANVVNIANTNINGGTWWLVFINQAGNWIGKLVGSPDGSTMAGSEGTEFTVGPDGQVNVSNGGNGAGSNNTASNDSSVSNTTNQSNTADIHNTLNLDANTGGNTANYNTGGNNAVVTGDANVIANIVNFVNNNIVGNGKLAVTFINVFGSWVGNVYTPGHEKPGGPDLDGTAAAGANENHLGGVADANSTNETVNTTNETIDETVNHTANVQNEEEPAQTTVTKKARNYRYSYAGNSGSVNGYNDDSLSGETKVAGIHTENDGFGTTLFGSENKKVMRVNLAYIVLLIPLFALALVTRKVIINRVIAKRK